MKVELAVLTGRWAGKAIQVPRFPFVIGRDPACHLRASSPKVGPRQCALVVCADKVLVRELEASAGTFLNGRQIQGEQELHADDRLEVGPLAFGVRIEEDPTQDQVATPTEPAAEAVDEESAAAFLLEPIAADTLVMSAGNSAADTVAEKPAPRPEMLPRGRRERKVDEPESSEPSLPDTAAAARAILAKCKHKMR